MGTAGLVLGITGLAFFPFLLAPLFVVVGLPLSGAAFYRAQKGGTSLMVSVAGLATNAVAAALSTPIGWFFGVSALSGGGGWSGWAP